MRRRIEALADQLEEFVSEDGHDALVIMCAGEGAGGMVGAAADLLEQRGSSDVSIPAFEAFEAPEPFAERLVAYVDALLREAGLEQRSSSSRPALEQMTDALVHLARAVRARGDVRVALWVCPAGIEDRQGYLDTAIALACAARRVDPPLRLGLREPSTDGALRRALASLAIPTLEARVDMSMTALRDAMAEEAADPSNDPDVRASALLSAAMADATHGRADEALPVLAMLASVFEARGDVSSRALCFVLGGNVLAVLGDLDQARERVSQGLALALQARAVGVVLGGAMLAGHLSMRAGDLADADVRFDVAARIGAKIGAPLIVADALTQRGKALVARGSLRAACDAWLCAAEAGRRARSIEHERAALQAVAEVLRDASAWEELAPIERRMRALPPAIRWGCSHEHEHEHEPPP